MGAFSLLIALRVETPIRRHLRILNLLGVRKGLIALTKISLADDDLREIVSLEIKDHLKAHFLRVHQLFQSTASQE